MLIAVRSVGWIFQWLGFGRLAHSISPLCHQASALRNPLAEGNDDFVAPHVEGQFREDFYCGVNGVRKDILNKKVILSANNLLNSLRCY